MKSYISDTLFIKREVVDNDLLETVTRSMIHSKLVISVCFISEDLYMEIGSYTHEETIEDIWAWVEGVLVL